MRDYSLHPGFIRRPARFVKDLLVLCRPVAALCAGAEVVVGAHLTRHASYPLSSGAVLLRECIAISLVTATVNVVNDIHDISADAINRPNRPLPAGRLSSSDAWWLASFLGIAALTLSIGIPAGLVVTLVLLLIGIGYSYTLKGTVLAGNFVVALLASVPIVYGARLDDTRLLPTIIAASIIFTFMFAFEVLKTIRDVIADSVAGYRTVATQWGTRATSLIFRISLVAYVIVAVWPMLFIAVSAYYIIFMLIGAVIPSLAAGCCLPVDRSATAVRRVLHVMTLCWVPGLIALLLAFQR